MRDIVIVVALFSALAVAAGPQSPQLSVVARFSGKYVLAGANGDLRFDPHDPNPPTLTITQTDDELTVSRTAPAGSERIVLPLDCHQAQYSAIDGQIAMARMAIHGKELEVDEDTPVKQYANLPKSFIHSVERWKLSGDGDTLKICGHADAVNFVVGFRKSGCQIFKRIPT